MTNKKSLNCFDYALGNADESQTAFSQPMKYAPVTSLYSCPAVEAGMLSQLPTLQKSSAEEACKSGQRKIALVVDPKGASDYHFYRQDRDGKWSHKPGWTDVRQEDAAGEVITLPHLANHNYEHFNYEDFCGYYCVDQGIA